MKLLLIFLCALSYFALGEIIVNKTCSSYNLTIPLISYEFVNQTHSSAKWYEIATYGKQEKCASDYVNRIDSTFTYNVTHSIVKDREINKTYIASLDLLNGRVTTQNHFLRILAADYNNYLVFWNCLNHTNASSLQTLIVSFRNKSKKIESFQEVNNVIKNISTGTNATLAFTDHVSCKIQTKSSGVELVSSVYLMLVVSVFLLVN